MLCCGGHSVTPSPVALRTYPVMERRRKTLPRCPRVLRSPAPKRGRVLVPTARRPGTRPRGPPSCRRRPLSGAWKRSAGSSPRSKASHSSAPPRRPPLVGQGLTFPCLWPGCEELAAHFLSQEIDGQALLLLREDHLISTMNIKLGPALKICASINTLRE